jgi:hypothetical protein
MLSKLLSFLFPARRVSKEPHNDMRCTCSRCHANWECF